MATAKSNNKIPKTDRAGKAKPNPEKAAKAATAKSGAGRSTGAKGGGKKAGLKNAGSKTGPAKKTIPQDTAGDKTAASKTAAPKTTAASKTAPPKKPAAGKRDKPGSKAGKPAFDLEHIDGRTLTKIIAKLEEMRNESQQIVNAHMQSDLMPREESLDVGDDLDQASNERDREFNLIMHQRHLRRLRQIEEAYGRMDDGSYGLCEGTDEPINPKRLLIMPLTKFSIEYQEMQEKTLGRVPLDESFSEIDESFGTDE